MLLAVRAARRAAAPALCAGSAHCRTSKTHTSATCAAVRRARHSSAAGASRARCMSVQFDLLNRSDESCSPCSPKLTTHDVNGRTPECLCTWAVIWTRRSPKRCAATYCAAIRKTNRPSESLFGLLLFLAKRHRDRSINYCPGKIAVEKECRIIASLQKTAAQQHSQHLSQRMRFCFAAQQQE